MSKKNDLDKRVISFEEKWDSLRLMIAASDLSDEDKVKMTDLLYDLLVILYDLEEIEI